MKKVTLAAASWFLLFPLSLSLRADGTFPLQYQQLTDPSHACAVKARQFLHRGVERVPAGLKPGFTCYSARTPGRTSLLVALDPSNPSHCYADTDGDGDLSDESPLPRGGTRRQGTTSVYQLGPVFVQARGAEAGSRSALRVEVYKAPIGSPSVAVYPAGVMSGRVTLGGRTYQVGVVDGDYDGRYDGVLSASSGPTGGDWLAIDLNGDGRIDGDIYGAGEIMPLPKMIRVNGTYYGIEVAQDGSAISLLRTEPDVGVLDIGYPHAELTLLSDSGPYRLSGNGGRWQLPAGQYFTTSVRMSSTDSRRDTWTLQGEGNTGRLASFGIRGGETLSLRAGPPLTIKTEARSVGTGLVSIGCLVAGQAGEEYLPGVQKNGRLQKAPKFKIIDERGRTGVSDSFEYG